MASLASCTGGNALLQSDSRKLLLRQYDSRERGILTELIV